MDQDLLIHPGEILKTEFLEPHGLNAHQLAKRLDVPPNAITAIINGTRGVTGRMSQLLGRAFGMSEGFFANLQTQYELDVASVEAAEDEKVADRLRRADLMAKELCLVDQRRACFT